MDPTITFADGREEAFPTEAAAERFALYWMIHRREPITLKTADGAIHYTPNHSVHLVTEK